MPMGMNACIKWSMLELRGLLEDEDARVHFQRSKRHLGLHPFQLNDLNRALREILSSKVNFYDSDLQGLVLAYKNPKLLDSLGGILHDSYFIHVDIEADFYIFRPEVGCTLKGIANKKAGNHLGILVHKAFNVSILKDDDCEEWLGDYVFVGQEVKFTVTHLDFKGKLPFIRGELVPDATMGQVYYDSMNNDEIEDKPSKLLVDEENSELSESRRKKSKKSGSNDGKEETGSFSRIDESEAELVKNEKNMSLDREESSGDDMGIKKHKNMTPDGESSSDDRDNLKSPGSSTKRLIDVGAKHKLNSKKAARDKRSSHESDSSKEEKDSRMEKKPKIMGSPGSIGNRHRKTGCTLKSQELENSDRGNEAYRVPGHDELDDTLTSPTKRSKKNRISDSEDDSVIMIDVKPDVKVRKKKNKKDEEVTDVEGKKMKKNKEKYEEEETEEDEEERNKKKKKKSKVRENEVEDYEVKVESEEERKKSKKDEEETDVEGKKMKKNKEKYEEEETEEDEEERKKKKKKKKFKVRENEVEDYEVKVESEEERKKSKIKSKDRKDEGDEKAKKNCQESAEDTEEEKRGKKGIKKRRKAEEETQTDVSEFDFIKPDLDAFEIPAARSKRKRRKTITENDEASVNSADDNPGVNDFFRDVRVKTEPDSSDMEDSGPGKKNRKRKKKSSMSEEMNDDARKLILENIRIKEEPNMSDIEESKSSKKKSKKKIREIDSFGDIKIKIESDATDVEGSSSVKHKFKRESEESSKSCDESITKGV